MSTIKDTGQVILDGPLLIRILEYCREDLSKISGENGDLALHYLADGLLSAGKPLTIDDYEHIVTQATTGFDSSIGGGERPPAQASPDRGPDHPTREDDSPLHNATASNGRPTFLWRSVGADSVALIYVPNFSGDFDPIEADEVLLNAPGHIVAVLTREEFDNPSTRNMAMRPYIDMVEGKDIQELGFQAAYAEGLYQITGTKDSGIVFPLTEPLPQTEAVTTLHEKRDIWESLGYENLKVSPVKQASSRTAASFVIPEGTKLISDIPQDVLIRLKQYGVDLYEIRRMRNYEKWEEAMLSMFPNAGPGFAPLLPALYKTVRVFYEQNKKTLAKIRKDIGGLARLVTLYHQGAAGRGWYKKSAEYLSYLFPNQSDRETAAKILAATSANVPLEQNVARFVDSYEDYMLGRPWRDAYHTPTLNSIITKGDNWAPSGPKIRNFQRALLGDPDAAVIDTHMAAALGVYLPSNISLSNKSYILAEKRLREVAKYLNEAPADVTIQDIETAAPTVAETQEQIWVGVRKEKGLEGDGNPSTIYPRTMQQAIDDHYNMVKTNPDKEKIWRPVWEGVREAPEALTASESYRVASVKVTPDGRVLADDEEVPGFFSKGESIVHAVKDKEGFTYMFRIAGADRKSLEVTTYRDGVRQGEWAHLQDPLLTEMLGDKWWELEPTHLAQTLYAAE